jgi:hypothetical protein
MAYLNLVAVAVGSKSKRAAEKRISWVGSRGFAFETALTAGPVGRFLFLISP